MPSKKKTTRGGHLQAQPIQSDYETDTANFTDPQQAALAPPPSRTNTELNLLVLRRHNPEVERIVQIAPFAVVYHFSAETQQWEKSSVEGTLFVCQLSGAPYPRYNVMILNRKSLDNFVAELDDAEDVEVDEHYVMLQAMGADGVPVIYGLWIFSEEGVVPSTREVIAMAMQECALRAQQGKLMAQQEEDDETILQEEESGGYQHTYDIATDTSPARPIATEQQGQQIDLLKLFGKSQVQQEDHIPEPTLNTFSNYMPQPQPQQQSQFISAPDTDFFRSSQPPVSQFQPVGRQPDQQNALLDLFTNAKRG